MLSSNTLYYLRNYVRRYNTVAPGGLLMSVSLQHYNNAITPGTLSIVIVYTGDNFTDSISEISLFI